jgi:hypothetical protein
MALCKFPNDKLEGIPTLGPGTRGIKGGRIKKRRNKRRKASDKVLIIQQNSRERPSPPALQDALLQAQCDRDAQVVTRKTQNFL